MPRVVRAVLIASLLAGLYVAVAAVLGSTNTTRLLFSGAVIGIWAFTAQTIDRIYGPKDGTARTPSSTSAVEGPGVPSGNRPGVG